MIKLERTNVFNWESAVHGMRNPMESWGKSDSGIREIYGIGYIFDIGPNDMELMKKLVKAGSDHRKFMRQIFVSVDITAPLYWWKEFDTYKVGTVANSTSTMHKIHAREFLCTDFSTDHMDEETLAHFGCVISYLEILRAKYIRTKDKQYWYDIIQLLPSSYNQMRTVTMNYEVLLNQYYARKDHKLDEWHIFCDWIESLPHFKEICGIQ